MSICLNAYFARIGFGGETAPTLETLGAIVRHHTEAIPFENLDPLLRRPVRLDSASLERKLIGEQRGGYCFEHNLLLQEVLEQLGYRTAGHAARMRWNVPEGMVTPRGHMLLSVEAEGSTYLVDVGFGGQTLTAPLRLKPGIEQPTPHEPFRLVDAGDGLVLESRVRGEWRPTYHFDLSRQYRADFEVSSWYLCHHPDSHFINGLIAARSEPGRRYALRNAELAVHPLDGESEHRTLRSGAEVREVLESVFRLRVPRGSRVDAALERVAAGGVTKQGRRPARVPPTPGARQ